MVLREGLGFSPNDFAPNRLYNRAPRSAHEQGALLRIVCARWSSMSAQCYLQPGSVHASNCIGKVHIVSYVALTSLCSDPRVRQPRSLDAVGSARGSAGPVFHFFRVCQCLSVLKTQQNAMAEVLSLPHAEAEKLAFLV